MESKRRNRTEEGKGNNRKIDVNPSNDINFVFIKTKNRLEILRKYTLTMNLFGTHTHICVHAN